jgi:hypothetical protein
LKCTCEDRHGDKRMFLPSHRVWVAILALLSLGWIGVSTYWVSYPIDSAISQYTSGHQHRGVNGAAEEENANESIARYTLGLMVFTFILAVATIGLGIATTNQLSVAREEFLSTHRPRLIVRQFDLEEPVVGKPLTIHFSTINVGENDAIWRNIAAEVVLWNGRNWEAPGLDPLVKVVSLPPVKNGQRTQMTIVSRFNVTEEQVRAINEGRLAVVAVGEFTYVDRLGKQHRTGFRRNYDVEEVLFITHPSKEYEYQD